MQHAQIAQLVEQRTENPCVAGSIPALGMRKSLLGDSFLLCKITTLTLDKTIFILKKNDRRKCLSS